MAVLSLASPRLKAVSYVFKVSGCILGGGGVMLFKPSVDYSYRVISH